jgi:uncharacterized RDD family membrane protein YckC
MNQFLLHNISWMNQVFCRPRPMDSTTTQLLEPDASSVQPATLGERFIAFVLDTMFLFAVSAAVDVQVVMRWSVLVGPQLNVTWAALLIALTLNSAITFVYVWLLEASFGATLGKAIVVIRVIRTNGQNAFAASAIRNLFRLSTDWTFTWSACW